MTEVDDSQWLYVCTRCGNQVTADVTFHSNCPDCHGSSWSCYLVENGSEPKTPEHQAAEPIKSQAEFCPSLINPDTSPLAPFQAHKTRAGRKALPMPGELIKELSGQGLSSRQIAQELERWGTRVSYKTILRVLSGQKQDSLL